MSNLTGVKSGEFDEIYLHSSSSNITTPKILQINSDNLIEPSNLTIDLSNKLDKDNPNATGLFTLTNSTIPSRIKIIQTTNDETSLDFVRGNINYNSDSNSDWRIKNNSTGIFSIEKGVNSLTDTFLELDTNIKSYKDINLDTNKNVSLQGTGKITTPNILVSGLTANKMVLSDANDNLVSSLFTDTDFSRLVANNTFSGNNAFSGLNTITGGLSINTTNQTIDLNNFEIIRGLFRFFPPNYQTIAQGAAVNPQTLSNTTINGSQYADASWSSSAFTPPADGTIPNGQPYYFRNLATFETTFQTNRTNLTSSIVLANNRVIVFIYNGHTSLYEFLGVIHNSSVPTSNQFNSRDNSFTLPTGRGTNNQILTSNGTGGTSWSSNMNISNLNVSSLTGNKILLTDASKNVISSLYTDSDFPRLIANNNFSGATNTFSNINASNLNLSTLTGSRILLTDASKNITSSLYIDTDFPRLIANNTFSGATNTFSGSIRSNIHTATATSSNFSLGESGDTGAIVSHRDLYIGTVASNKGIYINWFTTLQNADTLNFSATQTTGNINIQPSATSGNITIGNTTPASDSGTLTINKNINVATNKNLTLQGTGKITTPNILVSGLTGNKIVLTDVNDNLVSSSFTDTDFGRLTANNNFSGATNTFSNINASNLNLSSLTGSRLLLTDASKNLVSSSFLDTDFVRLTANQTISGNNLYSGNSTFSGLTWMNTTNQIINLNNFETVREIFRFYPPNYQQIAQGAAVNPQTLSNSTINGSQYADGAWNSSAFTPTNDGVIIPNGQPYYFRNLATLPTNFEINRTNLTGPINLTSGRLIIFIYNAHTSLYEFLGVINNSSVPTSLQFNGRDNSFTLPSGRGTNNQILTTNGAGTTSWSSNMNISNLNLSSLTSNRLLLTDGSKNLISSSLSESDIYTKTQVNNLDTALSLEAKRDGEYGFTEIPIKRIRIKQVANFINLTEIQLWVTYYSINGVKYSQNIVNGVDVTMTMSSVLSGYPESSARDNNFNTFLHTLDSGTQFVDINLTNRWYYSNIECLVIYNRDSAPYQTFNSIVAGRITNADVEFYDEYSQLITFNKITTLNPHFIKYVFNQSAGDVNSNTATDSTLYPIANTGSMAYNTAKHVVQLTKGLFSRNKEVNSVLNFNAFQNFYSYIDQYASFSGIEMRMRLNISRNFANFSGTQWAGLTAPSNLYNGAQDDIWSIWETNTYGEGSFIAQNGNTTIFSNPGDSGALNWLDEDSPTTWVGWRISPTGVITASSDRRLKEEITPIIKDDILDILTKIEIVNYKLKPPSEEKRFKNGKKRSKYEDVHIGVIAQDVRKYLKDVVVRETEDSFWTVKYQDLTYYFHLGTQELIKENALLKSKVNDLEHKLATLEGRSSNSALEERIKKLEDFLAFKFGVIV